MSSLLLKANAWWKHLYFEILEKVLSSEERSLEHKWRGEREERHRERSRTGYTRNASGPELKKEDRALLYHHCLEEMTDGIVLADPAKYVIYVNDSFVRSSGYSREDALGREITFTMSASAKRAFYEAERTFYETGRWRGEVYNQKKSGEEYPAEFRITALRGEDGKIIAYLGIIRDVSEPKRAEKERAQLLARERAARIEAGQTKQRFHNLVQELDAIVWEADAKTWQFTFVSQRAEAILGYAVQQWLTEPNFWTHLIHPEDRQRSIEYCRECTSQGCDHSLEYRAMAVDGHVVWLNNIIQVQRDAEGKPQQLRGIMVDVTERKRMEALLAGQKRVLELIAQGVSLSFVLDVLARIIEEQSTEGLLVSILLLDADGIHLQHGAAPHLPEEYNRTLDGLAIGSGETSCGAAAFLQEPVVVSDIASDPLWANHRDVALRYGLRACWAVPIFSSFGKVLGTFAMYYRQARSPSSKDLQLVDLMTCTAAIAIERKLAQEERDQLLVREQMARAEAEAANRTKDEFLATVSHELRTPLTPILGWSRLLRSWKFDPTLYNHALEIIERNAKSQAQIIEDLLDISRIITGKLRLHVRPMGLVPVIEAAIDSMRTAADAKGIQMEAKLDPHVEPISGDPDRLQQVVWNLLSNAVKFTPEGGRIEIRLERIDSHVQIAVSDTGVGISSEFLPHVFDRFRQADGTSTRLHGGLGLGLAIVRYLVELHGGTVHVESPGPEQGSTFTVKLPITHVPKEVGAVEQHTIPHSPAPDGTLPRLDGLRVLVVDDETDARDCLATMLQQYGAEVITAASSVDAMQALARAKPDVLLSDISMPDEDGYTLIRKVRTFETEQGRHIPAVALTAYTAAEDRLRALSSGFQIHMSKPIEPADLVMVVASLTGRKTP